MGADLFIRSIYNKCREQYQLKLSVAVKARDACVAGSTDQKRWQKKVNAIWAKMYTSGAETGYFRDCYSDYGLFAQMSLSWWRDVIPMCDEDGLLQPDKARELRTAVAAEKLNLTAAIMVAAEQNDKPPTIEEYESWRGKLLAVLDKAIELDEPVYCSL